jgi:hypothetical protein
MTKKALCVGINDYPYVGNDLKGCLNDVKAWSTLLADHYDFAKPDIQVLTDSQATKANVLAALKALIAGAKSGDVLVYTNSSHGSYKVSTDKDEDYDELICPYDIDTNEILDDDLYAILQGIPKGVRMTVVLDNCFSGTGTRLATTQIRPRFLPPSVRGQTELINPFMAKPKSDARPQSEMNEILVSGCTDNEYSYDANFGGIDNGAMTYFAMQVIQKAKYKLTYDQLVRRINQGLKKNRFPQHPRLEGKAEGKKQQIFA